MAHTPKRYKIRSHREKHKDNYKRPGARFQHSDLGFNFQEIREVHFLRFEFQSFGPNDFGNLIYMAYRAVFATAILIIFWAANACSDTKLSMSYLYFNQWAVLFQMIYGVFFFLCVLTTTFHHCFARDEPQPEEIMNAEYAMFLESRPLGKLEKVVWFFHNISVTMSIMVSINFAFKGGDATKFGPIRECNEDTIFAVFRMTAILSLVEVCIVSIPIRLGHAMYTMIMSAIYLTFTVIYELADGKYYCVDAKDCHYIYEFLDYSQRPGHAAINFVVYTMTPGACHVLLFLFYKLRLLFYSYTCKNSAFLDHEYPFLLAPNLGQTSRGYFGVTDPDNPFPKRILVNDGLPMSRAAAIAEVQKVRQFGAPSRQNFELESVITPFPKNFTGDEREF